LYSSSRNMPAPSTKRITVVVIVSLTCRLQRRGVRHDRARAKITGKPRLPTKTPIMSSVCIQ